MRHTVTLCLLLLEISAAASDADIKRVFQYIFHHPGECGDPFANDSEWIPAHRLCTHNCDITTEICMKGVNSDKQRCDKLPAACVRGLKMELTKPPKPARIIENNDNKHSSMHQTKDYKNSVSYGSHKLRMKPGLKRYPD